MRTGVEAVEHRLALIAGLAQIGMAVSAGQHVVIEHRDPKARIGEQGRSGETADACADNGDVAIIVLVVEGRRWPMIGLACGDHLFQREVDQKLRSEDRDQRAADDDDGGNPAGRGEETHQRQHEEQSAPERRKRGVDGEELRGVRIVGIGGARIVGGPGTTEAEADQGDRAEAGEGEPQRVGGDRFGCDQVASAERREKCERAQFQNEIFAARQAPGFQRRHQREGGGESPSGHAARQQREQNGIGDERELDCQKGLHGRPRARLEDMKKAPADAAGASCFQIRSAGPDRPAAAATLVSSGARS